MSDPRITSVSRLSENNQSPDDELKQLKVKKIK